MDRRQERKCTKPQKNSGYSAQRVLAWLYLNEMKLFAASAVSGVLGSRLAKQHRRGGEEVEFSVESPTRASRHQLNGGDDSLRTMHEGVAATAVMQNINGRQALGPFW